MAGLYWLKGDPGCGKTKLALAAACLLYGDDAYQYFFEWHIKSVSKAKEGLYTFDYINRLRDATLAHKGHSHGTNDEAKDNLAEKVKNPKHYINLGPVGLAFLRSTKEKPAVLLIDEIDKGDIDFPNDLLLELDEMRFKVPEIDSNYQIEAQGRPLVIITSNDEKELPAAFMRRCLFCRIPSFDKDFMTKIIMGKLDEIKEDLGVENGNNALDKTNVEAIVKAFMTSKNNTQSTKPPSTGELIDLVRLIQFHILETADKEKNISELLDPKSELGLINMALEKLDKGS